MTDLLSVEQQPECLLDLSLADSMRPPRKESFIDLMEDRYTGFLDYDAVEKLDYEALMTNEVERSSSDVESTASSFREELELPRVLGKKRKRERHAVLPKLTPIIPIPQPPKQIGLISIAERQAKIQRYLDKRARRCWNRKISYDCRKRVADGRLRVKGRFVSKTNYPDPALPVRDDFPVPMETIDCGCDVLRDE